ncbi:MAG: plasmid stabilization protein [Burkholderiaceae bacterium]|jgi:plasmid stability protein|nr:plasmid stabilization protein [Burkholderiaceae bacterium]
MAQVLVRNLPDEVHRALRVRAAIHNRSTEAEARSILASAVLPQPSEPGARVKLGTLLAEIGRKVKLTDEEFAIFESARDKSSARAASFE